MSSAPRLPTGMVTLLVTGVDGSVRLVAELGDRYSALLADHHRILGAAFGRHGGVEVAAPGESLFYAFATASEALAAVADGLSALGEQPQPVRIGIHTGEPLVAGDDYVGACLVSGEVQLAQVEELMRVDALSLRPVHRAVRVNEELLRGVMPLTGEAETDAGGDVHLDVSQGERPHQRGIDACRDRVCLTGVVEVFAEDHEFVTV